MLEMESMYKELGIASLNPEFCERLATSFSFAPNRAGKPAVTWEQVQNWFEDRLNQSKPEVNCPPMALNLFFDPPNTNIPTHVPQITHFSEGKKATDLSELMFEARSSKDCAWYDVASFLTYRVLCTGELEVRVRFAGYSNAHDEWVNLKRSVRERSIPLVPSECDKVHVGDLVLCFQLRQQHAVYYDAHLVGIQRRLHDTADCNCIFVVRYDHDYTEEVVPMERLCRRS
uniref:Protein SAWADEE HOMEODOMAIN HOMOLOG 1 n=1 Tax=Rhizophora mucronata TaxID=61149 RepID=A0A2P2IJK4_RHIMU